MEEVVDNASDRSYIKLFLLGLDLSGLWRVHAPQNVVDDLMKILSIYFFIVKLKDFRRRKFLRVKEALENIHNDAMLYTPNYLLVGLAWHQALIQESLDFLLDEVLRNIEPDSLQ